MSRRSGDAEPGAGGARPRPSLGTSNRDSAKAPAATRRSSGALQSSGAPPAAWSTSTGRSSPRPAAAPGRSSPRELALPQCPVLPLGVGTAGQRRRLQQSQEDHDSANDRPPPGLAAPVIGPPPGLALPSEPFEPSSGSHATPHGRLREPLSSATEREEETDSFDEEVELLRCEAELIEAANEIGTTSADDDFLTTDPEVDEEEEEGLAAMLTSRLAHRTSAASIVIEEDEDDEEYEEDEDGVDVDCSEMRSRLWAQSLLRLKRSVDEVYSLCEFESDEGMCRHVRAILETAAKDFESLVQRLEAQQEYVLLPGDIPFMSGLAWTTRTPRASKSGESALEQIERAAAQSGSPGGQSSSGRHCKEPSARVSRQGASGASGGPRSSSMEPWKGRCAWLDGSDAGDGAPRASATADPLDERRFEDMVQSALSRIHNRLGQAPNKLTPEELLKRSEDRQRRAQQLRASKDDQRLVQVRQTDRRILAAKERRHERWEQKQRELLEKMTKARRQYQDQLRIICERARKENIKTAEVAFIAKESIKGQSDLLRAKQEKQERARFSRILAREEMRQRLIESANRVATVSKNRQEQVEKWQAKLQQELEEKERLASQRRHDHLLNVRLKSQGHDSRSEMVRGKRRELQEEDERGAQEFQRFRSQHIGRLAMNCDGLSEAVRDELVEQGIRKSGSSIPNATSISKVGSRRKSTPSRLHTPPPPPAPSLKSSPGSAQRPEDTPGTGSLEGGAAGGADPLDETLLAAMPDLPGGSSGATGLEPEAPTASGLAQRKVSRPGAKAKGRGMSATGEGRGAGRGGPATPSSIASPPASVGVASLAPAGPGQACEEEEEQAEPASPPMIEEPGRVSSASPPPHSEGSGDEVAVPWDERGERQSGTTAASVTRSGPGSPVREKGPSSAPGSPGLPEPVVSPSESREALRAQLTALALPEEEALRIACNEPGTSTASGSGVAAGGGSTATTSIPTKAAHRTRLAKLAADLSKALGVPVTSPGGEDASTTAPGQLLLPAPGIQSVNLERCETILADFCKVLEVQREADFALVLNLGCAKAVIDLCSRIMGSISALPGGPSERGSPRNLAGRQIGNVMLSALKWLGLLSKQRLARIYLVVTDRAAPLAHAAELCLDAHLATSVPMPEAQSATVLFLPQLLHLLSLLVRQPLPEQAGALQQTLVDHLLLCGISEKLTQLIKRVEVRGLRFFEGVSPVPLLLLRAMSFLSTLVCNYRTPAEQGEEMVCAIQESSPFALTLKMLRRTELFGIVGILVSILLSDGRREKPPGAVQVPRLPQTVISLAVHAVRTLNNVARLDLATLQETLGALGRPEFYHLLVCLLDYCASRLQGSKQGQGQEENVLLHETIALLGHYCLQRSDNQGIMCYGEGQTLLAKITSLPLNYFMEEKGRCVLFPTILASCFGSEQNLELLRNEMNLTLLRNFLTAQLAQKDETRSADAGARAVDGRFPPALWRDALAFFS